MRFFIAVLMFFISAQLFGQNIFILDQTNQTPVSFATISFGDGRGTFAGDQGEFTFELDKYVDIDTLFISSIGYGEKAFATKTLPQKLFLLPETSELEEVILIGEKRGKFKKRKLKETTHTEYFTSWLPTVESEVAVFFKREEGKSTKIAQLKIPINSEKEFRKKGNLKFSTLFRIQFYKNDNGIPGKAMVHKDIIFRVSEKNDEVFELDIDKHQIFIPENGLFASLQVLGYADPQGKLIQTKKYNEIETPRGVQKVSVTFRPLLPFTNKLPNQKTFVRRIFFNDKQWQVFDRTYNVNSNLVKMGFVNYGMGAVLHVYKD
ncbi:carboxypeptidase-like regulatory domain-containing protein [Dokdonia sp. Hel_I_53]|uniref:carboxypeptidase-like regulatory domain-containing protein n=1 Tax=Dokdonia sp. Hel_I_53 TaxID=1566287 RepID=UPI0011998BC6|nr:carboxypeptidase-like regulatory domain-containing protein [Dokdonia sp. Hel_I_53]TVZ52832.1 hypothetical protein OD90_2016 [Dokdonia sp. Hel_I_53]